MMNQEGFAELLAKTGDSLRLTNGRVEVTNPARLKSSIDDLVRISVFGSGQQQARARFLLRAAAQDQGILPSSIHDLYLARGRGEVPSTFTVPAMNLRGLSYYAARAVFRAAKRLDVGALIFEIARSEIGYTDQRPAEYATNVLAAALREGFQGPVFIQGDHFQISASRYQSDPDAEYQAVADLTAEAIAAGFYNIDVDTSTLVDLSQPTVPEQQTLNAELTARFTRLIRDLEPEGVTISIGGEIGEVGGRNSTAEELRAYMDGFRTRLEDLAPGAAGLSKISIQTGTSHGGVVLPDGSIAEVNVDFDTLLHLSQISRAEYGLGGAVQHGASTLPEDAFGKFAECEACEVHLATNFQTMMYDRIPDDLRAEIYAYLDQNHGGERKASWTDEQFYYKTQKRAIGPFKQALWNMDRGRVEEISLAWEEKFQHLFELLQVADTRKYVEQTVSPVAVPAPLEVFLGAEAVEEDTSDLAD
jgi:fructose/tagatose bisphosphate aldolase